MIHESPSFAQRIRSGPPPIGTVVTIESAVVPEALALAGIEWLFIDMEHGPLDIGAVQNLVRATPVCCHTLIRVPENSGSLIRRALDTGAGGIIIPQVNSGEEARAAVAAAKYPPQGRRSVGVGRAHGYGLRFADYVTTANESTSVILQIEDAAALDHLDDILSTPDITGILIGPYDLSGSLGHLGDIAHPAVQDAINRIRLACQARQLPVGTFVLDPHHVQRELAAGAAFLAVGTDVSYLTRSAGGVLSAARAGRSCEGP